MDNGHRFLEDEDRTLPKPLEPLLITAKPLRMDPGMVRELTDTGSFDIGVLKGASLIRFIQALPVPAMMVDQSHTIVFLNDACSRISRHYKALADEPFISLFPHPHAAAKAHGLIEKVFTDRKARTSEAIFQLGEIRIWGRLHLRPIRVGAERSVLAIMEDLTLEKKQVALERRYEKALQMERDTLSRRVEERTAALKAANEQLRQEVAELRRAQQASRSSQHEIERALTIADEARAESEAANRAKRDFLSNMSHELRTPLNAVIGFSEILEDKAFGNLNATQLEYVGHILNNGRHLLHLIEDILDLAEVESGKMELQLSRVNVRHLLESSMLMIRERAFRHQLALDLKLEKTLNEARIMVDEIKIKQVMFNLLSNASKFTSDGGSISVEALRMGEQLHISVSDTGLGLGPDECEMVFGAFHQVDSTYSRTQQGTGLGLALTRQMVELHGGKVWANSKGPGKGSTFSFRIPYIEADQSN